MNAHPEMSKYEQRAWKQLLAQVEKESATKSLISKSDALMKIKDSAETRASQAKNAVMSLPKAEKTAEVLNEGMKKAFEGLQAVTMTAGLNSVNEQKVLEKFAKQDIELASYEEIRNLDLKHCDRATANSKQFYMLAGMAEGAASSLAVTGLQVASTVSAGVTAPAAVGALAADTATVLTGMGRIVASIAAHYGYDVKDPEEAMFAMGVISYSSAAGPAEKAASLASLSRLTQQMMRNATWTQLSKNQLVKVIQKLFATMGLRLTKKKLAQAIPVAGALINSGMNAKLAKDTYERAHQAYRLRFLTEKYGLDPAEWAPKVTAEVLEDEVDVTLVDEVLEAEIVDAQVVEEDEVTKDSVN